MIEIHEKISYETIKEDFYEIISHLFKRILGLWIFVSIYVTNIIVYDASGLSYMRKLMFEIFNLTISEIEIWVIWYLFLFLLISIILVLFFSFLYIIYRIKPEWY